MSLPGPPSDTPLTSTLASQQKDYDCTPCRIMGSATFVGLGAYTYYSGNKQLAEQEMKILKSGSRFGMGARKGAILGTSVVLAALGMYRLVN